MENEQRKHKACAQVIQFKKALNFNDFCPKLSYTSMLNLKWKRGLNVQRPETIFDYNVTMDGDGVSGRGFYYSKNKCSFIFVQTCIYTLYYF